MTDPAVKQRLHDVYAMKDLVYPMGAPGEPASGLLGRAAPDLLLDRSGPGGSAVRLAALQRTGRAVLLRTPAHGEPTSAAQGWRDRVDTVTVEALPAEAAGALLIRPDGYVAWTAATGPGPLTAALHRWFGEPVPAEADEAPGLVLSRCGGGLERP
ncbi:hypothetical protein AB0K93_13950 [Streptomyces sp. NPDC052676]|uniref:aromatic-ring hydroxylase C-terminal domain-containing protein n=1 Tax=Streptomyces sp. NPDC052676 TaxID=3154953 RepID=UPI003444D044